MVRNLSWPAVSHICSFTLLPSSSIVRILKSIPIVVIKDGVNESSLNRSKQHDLPTPESPMSSNLICWNLPSAPHRLGFGTSAVLLENRSSWCQPWLLRRNREDFNVKMAVTDGDNFQFLLILSNFRTGSDLIREDFAAARYLNLARAQKRDTETNESSITIVDMDLID